MADPKYANLPGIAWQETASETDSVVETLHVSSSEAFGKFKGKHMEASKVDFSDRLRPGKKLGYVCWSGDLELHGGPGEETPLQKYQRLNCEVRELFEELDAARESFEKSAESSESGELKGVATKVAGLQAELENLKLEEVLGSRLLKNLQDPQSASNAKLLSHLQQLKTEPRSTNKAKDALQQASDSGSEVTYELLMKPESSRLEESERLAEFDQRLTALEKAVGAKPDVMSSLAVETNQKSLLGAVSVLSARSSLFDPAHLDHIEGRLAAFHQKMTAAADAATRNAKQQEENSEKTQKVDRLYELAQTSDGLRHALPEVVDRLEALQGLHDQALQFSKALAQLDSVQQQLGANLATNQDLLKETQEKFSKNVSGMQKHVENLGDRMKKIQTSKK